MDSPSFFRVLDANLNRAREGLRVCEEVARMVLDDSALTRCCQRLRYDLSRSAVLFPRHRLLQRRDPRRDVGRPQIRKKSSTHRNLRDLLFANSQRVQEALRVLEEFSRLDSVQWSQRFASLRFRAYTLEQDLLRKLSSLRDR